MKFKFKRPKIRTAFFGFVIILIILALTTIFVFTGILTPKEINKADLEYWNYNNGVIEGASEFSLEGKNETCWLMIHGYSSTPRDYIELSEKVNNEFQDTIIVPRLKGHAEVPGNILNLTIDDWYTQIEVDFLNLKEKCEKVNVVGFSLGGAIALKLAENHEFNNLYLINPYLKLKYSFWNVFPLEDYISSFGEILVYTKNPAPGKINSPEGRANYIGYHSFALVPIKKSLLQVESISNNLSKVNENILVQHSRHDEVVDIKSSEIIIEQASSTNKKLIIFEKSNHILLLDYEKDEAINNIINFEKIFR